jgi:hypothetical protein
MSDEAAYAGTQDSATRPDNTRLRSARLRADIIRVAGNVAETQDRLVETLSRLASQHPNEARRLRATIEAAGNYAGAWRATCRAATQTAKPATQTAKTARHDGRRGSWERSSIATVRSG